MYYGSNTLLPINRLLLMKAGKGSNLVIIKLQAMKMQGEIVIGIGLSPKLIPDLIHRCLSCVEESIYMGS